MTGLSDILFTLTIVYVGVMSVGGEVILRGYLSRNLIDNKPLEIQLELIRWQAKAEETSFVLTGFAIVSLVFIISTFQKNLGDVEHIILFFSLAFIFEVISAFIHHDYEKRRAGYHGIVFQYSGILAILCGFLTYFDKVMPWSGGMYAIYIIGIIVFLGLTFREVNVWQRVAWQPTITMIDSKTTTYNVRNHVKYFLEKHHQDKT